MLLNIISLLLATLTGIIIVGFYIGLAKKYGILDLPNSRSSHSYTPVRGAGLIFPPAIIVGYAVAATSIPVYFITGLAALTVISFWDDIKDIPAPARLAVHLLASLLLVIELRANIPGIAAAAILFLLVVIFINGFNFMDGINGITGFYSIAVIIPVLLTRHLEGGIAPDQLLAITIGAILAFGWFNFRKRAACFAGDAGSVTMAFFIAFIVSALVVITNSIFYLLFVVVYFLDFGTTLLHRLALGEKIWQPHRLHLYQLLVNRLGYPHLAVAGAYALTQLVINIGLILVVNVSHPASPGPFQYSLVIFCCLTLFFLVSRYNLWKRINVKS